MYPTNGFDLDKDGVNDSKQLAEYYAQKRGIPASNVLGVPISVMGVGYYYVDDYQKFYNDLVGPIIIRLNKLGPSSLSAILLVGDIPKQVQAATGPVALDNVLMMLTYLDSRTNNISPVNNPYFDPAPGFRLGVDHFDHSRYKFLGKYDIYLVSRLQRMDQVDHSLYAERFLSPQPGYYNGNIYVDSKYGQGGNGAVPPYTDAYLADQPAVQTGNYAGTELETDFNIAFAEHYVRESGFPLKWENTTNGLVIGSSGAMFSDGTSALLAPRALFYGGWYNYGHYNDVWEWLPGSVACDLNSGSTFGWKLAARRVRFIVCIERTLPAWTPAPQHSALLSASRI